VLLEALGKFKNSPHRVSNPLPSCLYIRVTLLIKRLVTSVLNYCSMVLFYQTHFTMKVTTGVLALSVVVPAEFIGHKLGAVSVLKIFISNMFI
jgi:hypothetical protein